MFGSIQMVDMVTTRKNDFGRILVVVLDPILVVVLHPALIPSNMAGHYFELKNEKEKVGFGDNGYEVELDFGGSGDGGEGKEDENAANKDSKSAKPYDAIWTKIILMVLIF